MISQKCLLEKNMWDLYDKHIITLFRHTRVSSYFCHVTLYDLKNISFNALYRHRITIMKKMMLLLLRFPTHDGLLIRVVFICWHSWCIKKCRIQQFGYCWQCTIDTRNATHKECRGYCEGKTTCLADCVCTGNGKS